MCSQPNATLPLRRAAAPHAHSCRPSLCVLLNLPPPPVPPQTTTQDAAGNPLRPSFAVLAQASSSAKSWPITSPVRAFIDEAVSRTGGPHSHFYKALL